MRALGLDLGTRRVGVAVSTGRVATPYETLQRSGDRRRDHLAIAQLVADTEAATVVVGLPTSLDATRGPAAEGVLAEVDELAEMLEVPVVTQDERLSTVEAQRVLRAQGVKAAKQRAMVDQVAASIILQSWLDQQPSPSPEP